MGNPCLGTKHRQDASAGGGQGISVGLILGQMSLCRRVCLQTMGDRLTIKVSPFSSPTHCPVCMRLEKEAGLRKELEVLQMGGERSNAAWAGLGLAREERVGDAVLCCHLPCACSHHNHATELSLAKERIQQLESLYATQKAENERLKRVNRELEEKAESAELQINSISREYRALLEEKEVYEEKSLSVPVSLGNRPKEINSLKQRHHELLEQHAKSALQSPGEATPLGQLGQGTDQSQGFAEEGETAGFLNPFPCRLELIFSSLHPADRLNLNPYQPGNLDNPAGQSPYRTHANGGLTGDLR
ncbi:hypothetical protein BaRGS_00003816 [Batillaria attramentaria]|uniref:Uncharacterized protein n=1 Tax=Batillaria attramentaria TaxID=370345 RepID=A0ABD0LZ90_9CAEN